MAALIFLLGGTLMTAAQGSINMVYGGRLVAGLGIGASSLTVPVYISETAPPSIRGRLIGMFEIASQGGGMLGFWINYATDATIDVRLQAQWVSWRDHFVSLSEHYLIHPNRSSRWHFSLRRE